MKPIRILGARLDLGQTRRGVDMGPSAIRYAGLQRRLEELEFEVADGGDIAAGLIETRAEGDPQSRFAAEIAEVCAELSDQVYEALSDGELPVILGGDHSLSIGSIGGAVRHFRETGERLGLIWIDAHPDMNTPATSLSGNIHGMVLGYCLGLAQEGPLAAVVDDPPLIVPENMALIGIRDIDPGEREHLLDLGVTVFTMRELDELGVREAMRQAIEIATDGTAGFHLSLDLDALEPQEAPGVGTPSRGGMSYREAHLAMEMAADAEALVSMDVVEVNPILDIRNQTAELAVGLTLSALGKRIL